MSRAEGGLAGLLLALLAVAAAGQASPAPAPAPAAQPPASPAPTPSPVPAPAPSPAASPAPLQQPQPAGAPGAFVLAPFTAVVVDLPLNVLVSPSGAAAPAAYALAVDAEEGVRAALVAGVDAASGALLLSFNQSFTAHEAARINVSLPPDRLAAAVTRGPSSVFVAAGFATAATRLEASGGGRVLARGLDTQRLTMVADGTSDVFARGSIGAANVTADGTSTATLSGARAVEAHLDGLASLFVDAPEDTTPITGEAGGLSKIYATRGKCDLSKQLSVDVPFFQMSMGLPSCIQVNAGAFPRYTARWSCGVRARIAEGTQDSGGGVVISVASEDRAGGDRDRDRGRGDGGAAAASSQISVDGQAGRRLASASAFASAAGGRRLRTLLPDLSVNVPVVGSNLDLGSSDGHVALASSSSSSQDGDYSASSSSGGGGRGRGRVYSARSAECRTPRDELYIPSQR